MSFELHVFNNRTNGSVIRRLSRPLQAGCGTMQERDLLAVEGFKNAVIEAQGPLFFVSTEQLLQRIAELSETARYVIVDFKRVHLAATSACKLILTLVHSMRDGEIELRFAEITNDGPLARISRARRA